MLPARKEVFQPAVIAHDTVDDPSGRAHDWQGNRMIALRKRRNSIFTNSNPRSPIGHEQPVPGLEIPGQSRHHHVRPVAQQVVNRHAHGVDAVL